MAADVTMAYVATQVIAFCKTTRQMQPPHSARGSGRNGGRALERCRVARRTIQWSVFGRHLFPPWRERVIVRRRGTNKPAAWWRPQDANAGHRVAQVVDCQLDRARYCARACRVCRPRAPKNYMVRPGGTRNASPTFLPPDQRDRSRVLPAVGMHMQ